MACGLLYELMLLLLLLATRVINHYPRSKGRGEDLKGEGFEDARSPRAAPSAAGEPGSPSLL